jgi:hypothetical protein
MRVIFWCSWWFGVGLRVEEFGCAAVDEGAEDLDAFEAFLVIWWCHILLKCSGLEFVDLKKFSRGVL